MPSSRVATIGSDLAQARRRSSRLIDMVTARFGATAGWTTLSSETKWAKFMSVTVAAAAKAEVYHGLYLIYELITPKRNLVMLLLWWQSWAI